MHVHSSLLIMTATLVPALFAGVASAQQPEPSPRALPPIRSMAKISAASDQPFAAVSQVRALPDGHVLVNDNLGRRVVVLDSALHLASVVADTTSATANAYRSRAAGLISYRGDSVLFVDPSSLTMAVLDERGRTVRVMAVPRPSDAASLVGGAAGTPAFDAMGRLIYRGTPPIRMRPPATGTTAANGAMAMPVIELPDSAALLRVDLMSRRVDTVTMLKISTQSITPTQSADGRIGISIVVNPMQFVDDWVVTVTGRIAVIRGREYRVDWIEADGKPSASTRIPFEWRHLDEPAKTAYLDSTRSAMDKLRDEASRHLSGNNPAAAAAAAAALLPAEAAMFSGLNVPAREMAAFGAAMGGPSRGGGAPNISIPPLQYVSASELPDYAPAFLAGSALADTDGNLWVRTTNTVSSGSVYDVVDAGGRLIDRLLLPPGRVIAGFGPRNTVYMGVRLDDGAVRLERANWR